MSEGWWVEEFGLGCLLCCCLHDDLCYDPRGRWGKERSNLDPVKLAR